MTKQLWRIFVLNTVIKILDSRLCFLSELSFFLMCRTYPIVNLNINDRASPTPKCITSSYTDKKQLRRISCFNCSTNKILQVSSTNKSSKKCSTKKNFEITWDHTQLTKLFNKQCCELYVVGFWI